jgi:hypothetical protein
MGKIAGLADVSERVGQQGQVPGPLDRGADQPLVLEAGAGLAAGFDLAAVADVHAQAGDIFVVDALHLVDAEAADLAAAAEARALGT